MHFQFEVTGPGNPVPKDRSVDPSHQETNELLRTLIETQREQSHLLRILLGMHDAANRWRPLLSRWSERYPGIPEACKKSLPALERAYIDMITEVTDTLADDGEEALDTEYTLNEFLDRHGQRLNQMGALLSLVSPLADIATQMEQQQQANNSGSEKGEG